MRSITRTRSGLNGEADKLLLTFMCSVMMFGGVWRVRVIMTTERFRRIKCGLIFEGKVVVLKCLFGGIRK